MQGGRVLDVVEVAEVDVDRLLALLGVHLLALVGKLQHDGGEGDRLEILPDLVRFPELGVLLGHDLQVV